MKTKSKKLLFVVVDVWRGIASQARVFQNQKEANVLARKIRRGRNLDEDDIQVFECLLDDDSVE